MYKVKIASVDEFTASKDIWNTLASEMPFPSIFCTWEWIYTWWEHFGDKYHTLILFVFKGTELKGILPLASRRSILKNDWQTGRILTYCGSMELYPDHLDIISSTDEAAPCLKAISLYLSSEYKEWDVLYLSYVSEGNNLTTWCDETDLHFHSIITEASVSPFLVLTEGFEKYINTFHSKKRYNLKRMDKILSEQFGMKYVSCDPLNHDETLKDLFELHERRAKRKKIVSTFKGDGIVNFHKGIIQRINKKTWLWLRLLRNDEKTVAVLYCFAFGGRISYYQIGIDPTWEQHGPGKVLMYNAIKEAFSSGYAEFDFLRGNEAYKSYWTKKSRHLLTINIYNKTFMGVLSKSMNRTRTALKKLKKKIKGPF